MIYLCRYKGDLCWATVDEPGSDESTVVKESKFKYVFVLFEHFLKNSKL